MLAHPRPLVHVAALSVCPEEILTLDSQGDWIDPDTALAAACGSLPTAFSEEIRQVKKAIWDRVGPVTGILWFGLLFTGLSIHGYPDIRPTDAQLAKWLASIDVNRFSVGVYIEALGIVAFLPFAAWLYGKLKRGGTGSSWPALVMLAAASAHVILTLPINELYVGMVEQAHRGLDIHVAQTVLSTTQAWFEMTALLFALTLLATGVSILRGSVMWRWAGWAAIVIGVALFVPPTIFIVTMVGSLWFLAVAVYYTLRPERERELIDGPPRPAVATGLPATS